jgi:alkylation response protein AidB-like acyl-CoA dehydrogenase
MPIGISEEHEALRQTARGWVERHCAPAVPRSALDAETESLPPFWADLAGQGWLGLHVDEALGGEGYGLPELAVVLEELGRACAPGPFLPTVLASAVLQAAGKEIAADIVPGLASGETVGTLALGGRLDAEPTGDGLRVRGTLRAVPSAHLASVLVARAGEEWCALVAGEFTATELQSLDPTRRVAEVQVDGAVVPSARRLGGVETARVRDLAAAVFAAESVGVAQWCVDTASEYAKVREQFGRPIGQFQGVKHKCADMLAETELARAAAWDAARAADELEVAPRRTAFRCTAASGSHGSTTRTYISRGLRRPASSSVRRQRGGCAPPKRRAEARVAVWPSTFRPKRKRCAKTSVPSPPRSRASTPSNNGAGSLMPGASPRSGRSRGAATPAPWSSSSSTTSSARRRCDGPT